MTLTPEGSVHLRDGTIALDENRFTGAFDLVPGKARPKLTAQLATGDLALTALGGGGRWFGFRRGRFGRQRPGGLVGRADRRKRRWG